MNVLRIADVPNNPNSGMPRAMYATGAPLEALGHHIDYWFADDLHAAGPSAVRRFTVPIAVARQVRRALDEGVRYDVVEIHEPIAAGYVAARRSGATLPPCVIFSHGLEERRLGIELEYREHKHLPIGPKRRFSPHTVIQQAKFAVRHADHVMCCNQEDHDHLLRAGVPAERLSVKYSGVESSWLDESREPDYAKPAMLFVGSWIPRKGVLDLVPAVERAMEAETDATLTIVGAGAQSTAARDAFSIVNRSRVKVVPHVDSPDAMRDLMLDHSVLVLPSFYEGQPIVMLEAAACGLCTVTTERCGMRDFVTHERNGLFARAGDPISLASELSRLMRDAALRERLGRAARDDVRPFTWDRAARQVLAAYEYAANAPAAPDTRARQPQAVMP